MSLMQYVAEQTARDISHIDFFKPGDNVAVTSKIVEGDKTREQVFRGEVIQIKGQGVTKTFTVRKISNGVGVERIFPFNCVSLVKVENLKKGRVRRARLFYLREAKGASARITEKKFLPLEKKSTPGQEKSYLPLKGKKRKFTWVWQKDKVFA